MVHSKFALSLDGVPTNNSYINSIVHDYVKLAEVPTIPPRPPSLSCVTSHQYGGKRAYRPGPARTRSFAYDTGRL